MVQRFIHYATGTTLFVLPLIFFPTLYHSFVQGKELSFRFAVLILVLLMSTLFLVEKQINFRAFWQSRLAQILGLMFLALFLSTVTSPAPIAALYGSFVRGFGFFVTLFLTIWFIIHALIDTRERTLDTFLFSSYISALFVATYAILQKLGIDPFFSHFDTDIFVGRSFSSLGNPGFLGQFLALEFFIGMYLFRKTRHILLRPIFLLSLLPILAGILFSESRAALVGIAFGIFLLLFKYIFQKKVQLRKIIPTVLIGFILFFSLAFFTSQRFQPGASALRSLQSRFEIWGTAIELIAERPQGYGAETFRIFFPDKVDKGFFTLEEDLHIFADRIHNGFLEATFAGGIPLGILYGVLFIFLLIQFFQTRGVQHELLYLVPLINVVQNQFSFSDISISVLVLFLLAKAASLEAPRDSIKLQPQRTPLQVLPLFACLFILPALFFSTLYKPYLAHSNYTYSKSMMGSYYDLSILTLKESLFYAPQYATPWYDLLILDESSTPRALHFLSQIEGETGDVIAWRANYNASRDPAKAYQDYEKLLVRNPENPHWVRAYADALYKNRAHEKALTLYQRYLELVPDYWRWKNDIEERSSEDQRKYRIFFKNVPDFWTIVDRVKELSLT